MVVPGVALVMIHMHWAESSVAAGNAAWQLGERSTAIGNNAHSEGYGSKLLWGRERECFEYSRWDKKNVVAIGDDAQALVPVPSHWRKRSSWYIRTCT